MWIYFQIIHIIIQSTTRCERVPRQVTKTITFKECGEEMIETKTAKKVKIPCQKKLHRKQCLLSQDAEEDQESTPIDEGMVSFDLDLLLSIKLQAYIILSQLFTSISNFR